MGALKAYCKATVGIYASIHSFTSKIGIWIPKQKERKYDDEIADGNKRW